MIATQNQPGPPGTAASARENLQADGALAQIEDAKQYLDKHKIPLLMEKLAAAVLVERPANLREYILRKLQELKQVTPTRSKPSSLNLFTRENLVALFKIFDVTEKGYITTEQYLEAMADIGVSKPNLQPAGASRNRITVDTFCEEALSGLHRTFP